jgi:hypothetical protein
MENEESDVGYHATTALHPEVENDPKTGGNRSAVVGCSPMPTAEEPKVDHHQKEDQPVQPPIPEDRFPH